MDIVGDLVGSSHLLLDLNKYAELGKQLCSISKKLKAANFPLHGALMDDSFHKELRCQARVLHQHLAQLLSQDQPTRGCPASRGPPKPVKWNDPAWVAACDLLVSGGLPFDTYHQLLKKYDCSERCNSVWPTDFIAYRCTTCAFNPCMSLCADCFLNANHKGHDFNRFFSMAGGACDCGNEDVLNPIGFCTKHGPNRVNRSPAPVELTATLEFLLVKLFVRLLNTCRAWENRRSQFINAHHNIPYTGLTQMEYISKVIYDQTEGIVLFIQHFIEMGGPVIDVMSDILLNEQLYTSLRNQEDNKDGALEDLCATTKYFKEDLASLSPLQFSFSLLQVSKISGVKVESRKQEEQEYYCLLDECIFYLIRLNFPQTLINLLLCILSNSKYKSKFSCRFFESYPLINDLLKNLLQQLPLGSNEPAELNNRIIHISVQICSSANICQMLQKKISVTDKILDAVIKMFYWNTRPIQLSHSKEIFFNRTFSPSFSLECIEDAGGACEKLEHLTVDVEKNKFISKFGYSYLITDVQNIFAHTSLAFELMNNRDLCEKYVLYIAAMQGMNVLWRIVEGSHQEYENTAIIQRAFTLEWDASAQPMFNALNFECNIESDGSLGIHHALFVLKKFIKLFLGSIQVAEGDLECPPFAVTFHLPFHRHLAHTLIQALRQQQLSDIANNIILTDEQFLRQVILHPIRIQVVRAEYLAGMWIRNGGMIRNSMIYFDRPSFTFASQTLDLFLCRVAAANINQEFILKVIVKSFHLEDCFSFDEDYPENMSNGRIITSKNWISYLFDGCLRFLLDIIVPKVSKAVTLEQELRAELVCALSLGSSPHSKLRQSIPTRGFKIDEKYSLIFDKVLNEIADFAQPDQGELYQGGLYTLKESVWAEEFDPVLCRIRCNNAREFHSLMIKAEERDLAILNKLNTEDKKWNAHLWLGYPLLHFNEDECFEAIQSTWALLTQPTFFYIMQCILKRWLISDQEQNLVLQQAVYLLTLSVKFISSKCFEESHILKKLYHCSSQQSVSDSDNFTTDYHGLEIQDSSNRRISVLSFFTYAAGNESSILALLLAHFAKAQEAIDPKVTKANLFSNLMDSFINTQQKSLNRIYGSASEYLGRLLCLLYHSDSATKKSIDHLYNINVFKNAKNQLESIKIDQGNTEEPAAIAFKEKKLLAKRKQSALIQSQKLKQAKVMQKMMAIESLSLLEMEGMDARQVDNQEVVVYECPICNDSSTNTLVDLMGLMVYVQSNAVMDSVLGGHEKELSLNDIGMMRKKYGDVPLSRRTRRNWNQAKDAMLLEAYSDAARFVRLPSGISACTCGHTAHLACFQAYIDTVAASNSAQHVPFNDKVYSCPMCRQAVNAILPLKPELSSEKLQLSLDYASDNVLSEAVGIIKECILSRHGLEANTPDLVDYQNAFVNFEKVFRQINKFRRINADLSFSQEQMFSLLRAKGQSLVLGIVKNNVEHQQLLRRKKILTKKSNRKFNLIKHLLFGSRLSCSMETEQSVDQQETAKEFSKLVNTTSPTIPLSHTPVVPLLLHDSKSVLLRVCTYVLGANHLLDSDKFELCKLVYRHVLCLALCQIALHLLVRISEESVQELLSGQQLLAKKSTNEMAQACDFVCKSMEPFLSCFFNHPQPSIRVQGPPSEAIDLLLCLSESTCTELARFFIALLDEHNLCSWGDPSLPSSSTVVPVVEVVHHLPDFYSKSYLDLHEMVFGCRDLLASIQFTQLSLEVWIKELDHAMFEQTVNIIIAEDIVEWREPGLLTLPHSFDDLFSLFFGATCRTCNTSPQSPMICLICGEIICLDKCCSVSMAGGYTTNEIEKHSVECGSGCACFLSLHSTLVVITRNSQALIWGSVFLDSYGEEDRNLKRGKPLYLSRHRMDCLQKDWLEHNFVGKSSNGLKTWFPLEHVRQFLKDSHYYSY